MSFTCKMLVYFNCSDAIEEVNIWSGVRMACAPCFRMSAGRRGPGLFAGVFHFRTLLPGAWKAHLFQAKLSR